MVYNEFIFRSRVRITRLDAIRFLKDNWLPLVGGFFIIINAYVWVMQALNHPESMFLFCFWTPWLGSYVVFSKFKHPFLNGAYRMVFVFSFSAIIAGSAVGYTQDFFFVVSHAIHLFGFAFLMKRDLRCSILGLCGGFIALLLYIIVIYFLVDIGWVIGHATFFGVDTVYFFPILFFVCCWFIVNAYVIGKEIRKREGISLRNLVDL